VEPEAPPPADATSPTRSITLPLTVVLLLAAAWYTCLGFIYSQRLGLRGGTVRYHYRQAIEVSHLDLELHAAGVRRFAERNGRLPADLQECEAETPKLLDLLVWSQANQAACDWRKLEGLGHRVYEPWWRDRALVAYGKLPDPPGAAFDYLALPVLYQPQAAAPRAPTALRSDEAFSAAVKPFVEANGGAPAPSAQPFVLRSLAIDALEPRLALLQSRAGALTVLRWGGGALIILVGLLVCLVWDRRSGARLRIHAGATIGALIGAGCIVLVLNAAHFESYGFRSTDLGRLERLQLLRQAVERGDVLPEVAKLAREQIEALP